LFLPTIFLHYASFTYDGDGKRIKSVMQTNYGSSTTYFVGTHYELTDGVVTKYYYAGSQRIAMRKNGTLNYIIGDHLGSTSLVTDAAGVVVSQQQYKAWGETRYTSGSEATRYQYTGQYSYELDFGLQFYNARWYDSSLGRFTSADTIVPGGVQGYDRYAYANNNSLRYVDPDGHEAGNCYDRGYCSAEPTPTPTLGLVAGLNGNPDGINQQGPTWNEQMDGWQTDSNNMLFGLPTYTATYPGTANLNEYGKQGEADRLKNANKNPAAPTILICMSAGSEACMLNLQYRIQQNYKTTHAVLIGATWSGAGRDGFSAWTDIIDAALLSGTNILVVDDASVQNLNAMYRSPKTYTVPGQTGTYTLGEVPYKQNGYSVLPHHSSKICDTCIGANNSPDLVFSVYNFINTNIWSWNPTTP
jgi:RHS repeat-associated protein